MPVTEGVVARAREDGVVVVQLTGEHDVSTASAVRTEVQGLLDVSQSVVVDLTAATFLDSSILAVLLGGLRRARESEVGFGLVLDTSAGTPVQRIFEVTGLIPVFPIFPSRDGAVAAANEGRNT